mmetsp:Transcript_86066/g.125925  ORF Transcript_86066/g.125925 Transcript_86066/m.125925 type:complete len:109 (-) Transcript_86066:204-530(-)
MSERVCERNCVCVQVCVCVLTCSCSICNSSIIMSSKVNNQHPAAATTTLGRRDLRSELATAVLLFVQVAAARHCTQLQQKESPSDHDSPLCKLQDAVHATAQKCTLLA